MCNRLLLGFALLSALGCGSPYKLAPVSGKVTLNGQPLVNATIAFNPIRKEGSRSLDAGPHSVGNTNAAGEFALNTLTGENGALVGKHTVVISLISSEAEQGDARPPRGGWPLKDAIPARYNHKSELIFDVPPGGSTQANFDLKAP
jgi:hypothetical protein